MKVRGQRYKRGALNSMRPFSFFTLKIFSLISRFVKFAQVKEWCQLYQRGA